MREGMGGCTADQFTEAYRQFEAAKRARDQANELNWRQSEVFYVPLFICPPATPAEEPEGTDAQATQEAAAQLPQSDARA